MGPVQGRGTELGVIAERGEGTARNATFCQESAKAKVLWQFEFAQRMMQSDPPAERGGDENLTRGP